MTGNRRRVSRRPITALVAVGVLAVFIAGALAALVAGNDGPRKSTAPGGRPSADAASPGPTPLTPEEAGRAFLTHYVDVHGRVVRTDQGSDTVSEGQAYAMLIAVGVHDQATFTDVWDWTRQHLQRPDLLLSWRWVNGQVVDPVSASDADLDTARALVLAGRSFADQSLTAAGTALGEAVLDRETIQTGAGRILTAGSWATTEPYSYNPSYASPVATSVLAAATGDPRWAELDAGGRAVTAALLEKAALPPDWAQVHADGRVEAMPGVQGHGESVRYGYDAARTPIRFAESCAPADRALATRMLPAIDRGGNAAELDLGGTPLKTGKSVVAAVANAATAGAAGDTSRAARELADADELRREKPSYYGAAWDALGRFLLTTDVLGGCPPIPKTA